MKLLQCTQRRFYVKQKSSQLELYGFILWMFILETF